MDKSLPRTGGADEAGEIRALLRQSLETALGRLYGFGQRRAAHESPAGHSRTAWHAYAELGLTALTLPEEHGGLPGTLADLAMAAEAMGGALALEPWRPAIVAARLLAACGTPAQRARWLPAFAAGAAKAALAHEEAGARLGAPVAAAAARQGEDWRLRGNKTVVAGGDAADVFIVSAQAEGKTALFLVPAGEAERRSYRCFDWTGAADLTLDLVLPGEAKLVGGETDLARALDEATALACADAVGAIRAANRLTLEHARTRRQFGVPIGSFQVLQHRLVDMAIAEEMAGPITAAAVAACEGTDVRARARAVSAAKVKVGESARYVAQHCVQIHGGMGLVEEYPASHLFARLGLFERAHGCHEEHLLRFAALG
jgi:alkylation response protein AidB-like acyl-CoA dehydrogenase